MSEHTLEFLVFGGISLFFGLGIYLIGRWRNVDKRKIALFSACFASIVFLFLGFIEFKSILDNSGEKIFEEKIITRRWEKTLYRRGKHNNEILDRIEHYLCYQESKEICVYVEIHIWVKADEGDKMKVFRYKGNPTIYHETGAYPGSFSLTYFPVIIGFAVIGFLVFLLKKFFPDGSEEFGDDKGVTTIFNEYE